MILLVPVLTPSVRPLWWGRVRPRLWFGQLGQQAGGSNDGVVRARWGDSQNPLEPANTNGRSLWRWRSWWRLGWSCQRSPPVVVALTRVARLLAVSPLIKNMSCRIKVGVGPST
jgi:hypothetical protein